MSSRVLSSEEGWLLALVIRCHGQCPRAIANYQVTEHRLTIVLGFLEVSSEFFNKTPLANRREIGRSRVPLTGEWSRLTDSSFGLRAKANPGGMLQGNCPDSNLTGTSLDVAQ